MALCSGVLGREGSAEVPIPRTRQAGGSSQEDAQEMWQNVAELLGVVSPRQNRPFCLAPHCVPDALPQVPQPRTGTDTNLAQDLSTNTVGTPF